MRELARDKKNYKKETVGEFWISQSPRELDLYAFYKIWGDKPIREGSWFFIPQSEAQNLQSANAQPQSQFEQQSEQQPDRTLNESGSESAVKSDNSFGDNEDNVGFDNEQSGDSGDSDDDDFGDF